MSLTIDASVWIAAADVTDRFHQPSRDLLRKVIAEGIAVIQPAFARTEVAIDSAFLTVTETIGTSQFLRGADALYAAVAQQSQSVLISWDNEHLERASGFTPTEWLVVNPKQ